MVGLAKLDPPYGLLSLTVGGPLASGILPPTGSVTPPVPRATVSPTAALIESRLRMTRRRVRTVDTAFALVTFAAAVLAYLVLWAVVDQWVAASGLRFWARLLAWAVLITGGGYYLVRSVVPPLVFPISPVFAAQAIEQGWPNFKNSLINFLFLRRQNEESPGNELSRRVYQGLQSQAAAGLRHVSAETAVDRSHLVWASYALAAVVALARCTW